MRILVPTDFSRESDAAVNYALALARESGAEVEVLHVWDLRSEGTFGGRAVSLAPERDAAVDAPSEPRLELFGLDGTRVHRRLEFGAVCETILHILDTEEFDLVVMGEHTEGGIAHWLGWRTTRRVRRGAPCPLLTVRPGAERASTPPTEPVAEGATEGTHPASGTIPIATPSSPPPMVAFRLGETA